MSLSNKLAFGWVLHQHQPVGNFPWVFEQVFESCYAPLLAAFERHPSVRVSMHYSGPLLDWLLAHQPDYVARLAALVRRGQVEMLTGGYYEPILPILPAADQVGQIAKMNATLNRYFGEAVATTFPPQAVATEMGTWAVETASGGPAGHETRLRGLGELSTAGGRGPGEGASRGLWLTERVWEPNLPSVLAQANTRYTIVDDTHFLMAGLMPEQLYGYYITEDLGYPLAIFPNPKVMRRVIPFQSLARIRDEFVQLRATRDDQPRIVVMADDGEKFGSWPTTYDRLWRRGFMERFFSFLEDNQDWLETVRMGDYLDRVPPLGRVYLPTASYMEMMEWALPAHRAAALEQTRHEMEVAGRLDAVSFMRGGSWRYFFAKYPEANNFHKKMLRVHALIQQAAPDLDPATLRQAQDHLWQGQCNCGYWHGLFGGVYLADIRSAIYQHLIQAEALADTARNGMELRVTQTDLDCDGRDETLIEGPLMNVYIAPHDGGSIFEWDFKARPFNVLDTLARRPEAYHSKLRQANIHVVPPVDPMAVPEHPADLDLEDQQSAASVTTNIHDIVQAKEPGLEKLLHYDPMRRTLLRERFFAPRTSLAAFASADVPELGDFAAGSFTQEIERSEGGLCLTLTRAGTVQTPTGPAGLHLRKTLFLTQDATAIQAEYVLRNTSEQLIEMRFGIEGSWGMLGGGHNPQAWYEVDGERVAIAGALDEAGTAKDAQQVALVNAGIGVRVTLRPNPGTTLWRFPIETVANSEAGFERSYQCSATLLHWPLRLTPNDAWRVSLRMELASVE